MDARTYVAHNLSATLVAGAWNRRALLRRAEKLLGRSTRKSQRHLIEQVMAQVAGTAPPSPEWLVDFLLNAKWFDRASGPTRRNPQCLHIVLDPPKFAPAEPFDDITIPQPGFRAFTRCFELSDTLRQLHEI